MKIKAGFFVVSCVLLTSCSIVKTNDYKVIDGFINDVIFIEKTTKFKIKKNDTILVIENPIPKDQLKYIQNWFNSKDIDSYGFGHQAGWSNVDDKFNPNSVDFKNLLNQIDEKDNIKKWKSHFNKNICKEIVSSDDIYKANSKFNGNIIKKEKYIYSFSNVIYSKDKLNGLFAFKFGLNDISSVYIYDAIIIMKKKNNEWVLQGVIQNFDNEF